jgi:hypothetical protein
MEIALSPGDTQTIFLRLARGTENSFQCIIWLALAFFAEIPPVVGPFYACVVYIRLITLQVFLILNLNGVLFFLFVFGMPVRGPVGGG